MKKTDIEIREAVETDIPNLIPLVKSCFPGIVISLGPPEYTYSWWSKIINDDFAETIICIKTDGISGFCLMITDIYRFKEFNRKVKKSIIHLVTKHPVLALYKMKDYLLDRINNYPRNTCVAGAPRYLTELQTQKYS